MKIVFRKQDPQVVIEAIKEQLGGRKLGKIVEFQLAAKDVLEVTIRKMGTSSLIFAFEDKGDTMTWGLSKEKIALTHKAFRNEMLDKLVKVVRQVGGSVES